MKKIILAVWLLFVLHFSVNAQTTKVMTYNIRLDVASDGENDWNHRRDFLTSQIKFYEPDLFGVQEATPNQVQDLDAILTQYAHIGIGREGEGKGEASAIFFKKEKYTVSNQQTFWLSETPNTISKGWDASYLRVCTYALFRDKQTKETFWVFNTHLDNNGVVARQKGIELILAKIKEVNKAGYPVILTGDFNATPNSEVISNLRKAMTDTRDISQTKAFGPNGTFNGFNYSQPATELIDYIFVDNSKKISVKKHATLTDSNNLHFPSDHFPILVELSFQK
ncbi:Metal-dependent hydrolase, endonuclease/exonuclease/phosphatase family [Flexibacter flexilis DSM 6793]|uniref:Metal-dependent hydrolase, endonuclease/exonuclease/phosphatase family n=1 Tax=Flexibacter flexilis DSM 6793 TaxID=927664 RepID=A0A1I1G7E5_9BACT|nr:endonuclease/exonuclease/phosphatase family protein [Flexibacter flexilis]SFC07484.1 Metal-dependent hydrolase, endonuclease/exonuclease/phosphatase family [Flexibacter flexilis DSM 6793]